MSSTGAYTKIIKVDGKTVGATKNYTATRVVHLEEAIPPNSTDLEFNFDIDFSDLVFLGVEADAAMTIQTNNGTTPDDTLSVDADSAIVETSDDLAGFSLTADVDSIFVTSVAGGTLKIVAGMA